VLPLVVDTPPAELEKIADNHLVELVFDNLTAVKQVLGKRVEAAEQVIDIVVVVPAVELVLD
jgi:hypothetical protein